MCVCVCGAPPPRQELAGGGEPTPEQIKQALTKTFVDLDVEIRKKVGRVNCFPHACPVDDTMVSLGSRCKNVSCR